MKRWKTQKALEFGEKTGKSSVTEWRKESKARGRKGVRKTAKLSFVSCEM